MRRLLLIRHGETAWNAEARWQGWADVPLSPVGEAQARSAIIMLAAALPPDTQVRLVASSDLARALTTARILSDGLRLGEVQLESGLRERNVGDWSGLRAVDIEERWPGMLARWRAGELTTPPGGETNETMLRRVTGAVNSLLRNAPIEACVVAVTHGGVIRTIEEHLGLKPHGTRNLGARWVHLEAGELRAGESLRLAVSKAPAGSRHPGGSTAANPAVGESAPGDR
jgi:glucosyl-3-phosphoglycerate phosphatase